MMIIGVLVALTLTITYSYFGALFAFVAPSRTFPLDVTQASTLDSANSSTSNFSRDELVRINSTIEMALSYENFPWTYDYFDFAGNTSFRIVVSIFDNNTKPVYFTSAQKSIARGDSMNIIFDYSIASNAATGSYTVNILLWSDWLPSGVSLSSPAEEVTFDVS